MHGINHCGFVIQFTTLSVVFQPKVLWDFFQQRNIILSGLCENRIALNPIVDHYFPSKKTWQLRGTPISDAQKKSFLVSDPVIHQKNPIHIPIVAPFLLVKIQTSPPPKGGQSTALLNCWMAIASPACHAMPGHSLAAFGDGWEIAARQLDNFSHWWSCG